ncbi:MAG: hypothetical protein WDO69_05110 [Pseudomonadota bacterium]
MTGSVLDGEDVQVSVATPGGGGFRRILVWSGYVIPSTMFIGQDMFFGNDRFDFIADSLRSLAS